MALVFMEGFDHYTNGLYTTNNWGANGLTAVTGRFGGLAASTSNISMRKTLPSTYSTIFGGLAFQLANVASLFDWFSLNSGGTTLTMRIGVNALGQLIVRNSGGTTVATGTTVIPINTWNYLEFKLVIAGASGSIELRLNGTAGEVTTTTGNFGSTNVDTINLNPTPVSGPAPKFDDIYLLDTTGSTNTGFLGDVRIATLYPSGAGTHTQFTPLSGTNFSNVNDQSGATFPDGDTSYVYDANTGDTDTYATDDVDSLATIFGVQHFAYARKDDAGARQIAPVIRQAGTDYAGNGQIVNPTYQYYTQIYNQDPTGSNWTAANVNADEFGFKVAA